MDINDERIAQCYTEIDRGSSKQAGERWGQPILVETHTESGKILINCQLQSSRQNKAKDDNKVTGRTNVKPEKRRCRKNRSPSALARSRK